MKLPPKMDDNLLAHLVLDYQLETHSHPRYIIHSHEDPKDPPCTKPRLEYWENSQPVRGSDDAGDVLLQKCIRGSKDYTERVVRRVHRDDSRNKGRQYPRVLEAATIFSHQKVFPLEHLPISVEDNFIPNTNNQDKVYKAFPQVPRMENPPLSEAESSNIAFQTLQGLQILHQRGFAHENLKAQSILIQQSSSHTRPGDWWIKITDFYASEAQVITPANLTMNGNLEFQAPELLQQEAGVDLRTADLWALGAIAFFMLTKYSPNESKPPDALIFGPRLLNEYDLSTDCKNFIQVLTQNNHEKKPIITTAIKHPWIQGCVSKQEALTIPIDMLSESPSFQGSVHSNNDQDTLMSMSEENTNDDATDHETQEPTSDSDEDMDAAISSSSETTDQLQENFCQAGKDGDLEEIKSLLEQGAKINGKNEDDSTALHYATEKGYLEIVQFLIDNGANVNLRQGEDKYTTLWNAAHAGYAKVVHLLLQHIKPKLIKASNSNGWTPINTAANHGYLDVVKLLYEAMPKIINIPSSTQWTPINSAADSGYLEVVRYLLEMGAKLTSRAGTSVLHHAAKKGHLEMVKYLTEAAPQLTDLLDKEGGNTPLNDAVISEHTAVVKVLLDKGADPNIANSSGSSPLFHAATQGDFNVVKLLFSHNADATLQPTPGDSALFQAAKNGHLEITQLMVEAAPQMLDAPYLGEKWTPLNRAADKGHEEIVEFLLAKGADPTTVTRSGQSPLYNAACEGHLNVVKILCEKAPIMISRLTHRAGWTPLNAAADGGYTEVVRFLLENEGDATMSTKANHTPLYNAANKGHLETVKLLFEYVPATINIQNRGGWTPVNAAADSGHLDIVEFLVEKGADVTIRNNRGAKPIDSALDMKHDDVVEFLLSHSTSNMSCEKESAVRHKRARAAESGTDIVKRVRAR